MLPLFAQAGQEHWFYTDVMVPVAVGILAAVIGVFGSWFVVSRTEKFRRLTRWEPYAESLWSRRVDLYCQTLAAARGLFPPVAASLAAAYGTEPKRNAERRFHESMQKVNELAPSRLVLLDAAFNEQYTEFTRTASLAAVTLQDTGNATELWRELLAEYPKLVNAARASLGTDALHAQSAAAIVGDLEQELPTPEPTAPPPR